MFFYNYYINIFNIYIINFVTVNFDLIIKNFIYIKFYLTCDFYLNFIYVKKYIVRSKLIIINLKNLLNVIIIKKIQPNLLKKFKKI